MNQTIAQLRCECVNEQKRSLVIPEDQNLGSRRWQRTNPNVTSLTCKSAKRKTEYLDLVSWEYRKYRTPTSISEITFSGVNLCLNGKAPYLPSHPTVKTINFSNCTFSTGLFLTNCPNLVEVHVSNCTGTIKLKNLWFKRLVFDDVGQTECVQLQDTRIFHIVVSGVIIGSDAVFSRKQKANTLRSEDFERELRNKLLIQKI